ncbi:hypothetical protein KIPB_006348 [Kipferlia bialata]|uniref:Uncharacterized protein n=1 Tax=Kipferlia bialata TaxID=797122 RepID=A0A391NMB7_9EUKA|nr:hypothetical protein KIPB_006348 [Kipferlia bialata]|eukprot:g6348.t1
MSPKQQTFGVLSVDKAERDVQIAALPTDHLRLLVSDLVPIPDEEVRTYALHTLISHSVSVLLSPSPSLLLPLSDPAHP